MFSKSFQPTQHKIIRILCLTAVVLLLSFLYGTRALFYAFFTDPAVLKGRRLPPVLCATAAAQPPGPDGTGYTAGPASPLSREPLRDPFRPGVSAPVRDDVLLPEARQGAGHPENPAPPVQTYRPDRSREPELFAVFPLDYISAADLHQSLADLGIRGRLALSAVSNALLFSGTMAEKQRLRELIRRLDVPGRQVTLQATILSVNRSAERDLGMQWNWDALPRYTGTEADGAGESGSGSSGSDYPGHFKFWSSTRAEFRFRATLRALVTSGKARVLATPSLITLPGKEASIFIGSHIPVVTEKRQDGESAYSTEYVDAGIKLTYLPVIGKDGLITSQVHTEVSTPVLVGELKNYRINSRSADTTVRMRNGETLAIGGLASEEEQRRLQQVPLLAKIPVLGELFKYRYRSRSRTEVIILLTPYLTEAGRSPAIYDTKLLQEGPERPRKKKDRLPEQPVRTQG